MGDVSGDLWFVARLRAFVHAMLYDESAAQRTMGAALLGLGSLIQSGGVIPGTDAVLPLPVWLVKYGSIVQMAAVYLVAGGKLPGAPTAELKKASGGGG